MCMMIMIIKQNIYNFKKVIHKKQIFNKIIIKDMYLYLMIHKIFNGINYLIFKLVIFYNLILIMKLLNFQYYLLKKQIKLIEYFNYIVILLIILLLILFKLIHQVKYMILIKIIKIILVYYSNINYLYKKLGYIYLLLLIIINNPH